MAKKSRTPAPPKRPVQAPQRRVEKHERLDADRRRLLLLMLFAGSGLVALAAVIVFVVVLGGGSSGQPSSAKAAAAMRAAGCTYQDVAAPKPPDGQAQHIKTLEDKVDWNTYPPAGGQHYPLWAVWDFYTEAVNPKRVVHNEEHGGVVLWWGPQTPASEIDAMHSFYTSSPNSMVGTPIGTLNGKSLGSKVATTAWTGDPKTYQRSNWGEEHVAICPKFDEQAFKTFRDAYRARGPEGIPASANNPGEGPQ